MSHDLSPELTELYKTHVPVYMGDIQNSFAEGDLAKMKDVAHNLASAMGLIGDTFSSELSRKLEKEEMTTTEMSSIIDELARSVSETLSTL